ncbi:type IVB secretion system protein IcmH/DotU [Gynuella sunshinyii]|uniref:Type IV / VI secretion system DotU domain-containing protein n=1 Tax=Gynuella sunshinyii YC6258 TaxID=1445510 RepID=A0A0C5VTY9_9GAMM|nr:type IVB secretion system protein IcmH/DotU [Gynuella sunshinyii]AJQ93819.1 hypothetical protein YC6258_01775 [Gynuella sunshinyii YC6258]
MEESLREMEAALVESTAPIFNLVEPLNIPEFADQVPESLRVDIEQAFIDLERRAFEKQWPATITRDIRFAMAAYVDELVMSSRWPKKFDWMVKPLCIEYFGESNAGEVFFNRLNELRQEFAKNRLVIGLFYTCLQFGYQGVYRIKGYDQLQAYLVSLRSQLEDSQGVVPRELADSAVPESKLVYRISGSQPYWVMVSIGAAILVTMVLAYGSIMKKSIVDSAERLTQKELTLRMVKEGDKDV